MTRGGIRTLNIELAGRGLRMCCACQQTYAATREHFTYTDKTHQYLHPKCNACRAKAKRDQYQSDPELYAEMARFYVMNRALKRALIHLAAAPRPATQHAQQHTLLRVALSAESARK